MVDIYIYSIHGVYKPTNITGGHHLVGIPRYYSIGSNIPTGIPPSYSGYTVNGTPVVHSHCLSIYRPIIPIECG